MTTSITTLIRRELDACIAEARRQGYDGPDTGYEFTAADLDAVTSALGGLPTRAEWADAGLPHVGSAHVSAAAVRVEPLGGTLFRVVMEGDTLATFEAGVIDDAGQWDEGDDDVEAIAREAADLDDEVIVRW